MWKFENESLFQIFKFISINGQQFFYFFGRKPYRLEKYGESRERYKEKTVILVCISIVSLFDIRLFDFYPDN
jgi:hypothetical protein